MNSTKNLDLSKLEKYNIALPDRTMLVLARVVNWAVVAGSSIFAVLLIIQWVRSWMYYYDDVEAPSLLSWIATVVVFVAAVIVVNKTGKKYRMYFVVVRQGFVMDRDTQGGGGYDFASDVSWHVLIYGYTYANELKYYWRWVSAGDWDDVKKGDLVDYR